MFYCPIVSKGQQKCHILLDFLAKKMETKLARALVGFKQIQTYLRRLFPR